MTSASAVVRERCRSIRNRSCKNGHGGRIYTIADHIPSLNLEYVRGSCRDSRLSVAGGSDACGKIREGAGALVPDHFVINYG